MQSRKRKIQKRKKPKERTLSVEKKNVAKVKKFIKQNESKEER